LLHSNCCIVFVKTDLSEKDFQRKREREKERGKGKRILVWFRQSLESIFKAEKTDLAPCTKTCFGSPRDIVCLPICYHCFRSG